MATPSPEERVWFITGASRGLGAAIARAVLDSGGSVAATARDAEAVTRTLGTHARLLPLTLDVHDGGQAGAAVQATLERFGRIDVLVNNAGFGLLGAVEEASEAEVERQFRTNVFGLLNVTRAVLPHLRQRRSGHVINISSVGGFSASPGWGIYNASKFAVEGLTEAMAQELAPLGIFATVVEPGFFRTDFLDASSMSHVARHIDDYESSAGRTRAAAATRNRQQPGDPAKLAQALLKLVAMPHPPLRLPLGADSVQRIEQKLASVHQELESIRALAVSTGFTP